MNSSKLSRLKSYIYDNRPKKLRRYVEKHKLDVISAKLKKNRSLLHYGCKHGSTECLSYLLSVGISGLSVDSDMNTPLHLVLNHALWLELNGKHDLCAECYTMMILPLIERFPKSLGMRNTEGDTCRYLLHKLVQRRQSTNTDKTQNSSQDETDDESNTSDDAGDDDVNGDEDDFAWRDKLSAEFQDECLEQLGRYEQDYSYTDEREQYDDWADRIRSEYYTRRRAQEQAYYSAQQSHRKRKHSDSRQTENDGLKQARDKMKKQFDENREREKAMDVWRKRMKYEERYKKVLDNDSIKSLSYDEIPWPSRKSSDLDVSVLFDGFDKSSTEYKKYLRDQKIRWHPDKFMQRFGRYLVAVEKDKMLQRVTSLSQTLNKLVTS